MFNKIRFYFQVMHYFKNKKIIVILIHKCNILKFFLSKGHFFYKDTWKNVENMEKKLMLQTFALSKIDGTVLQRLTISIIA